jgi:hypothetical protein
MAPDFRMPRFAGASVVHTSGPVLAGVPFPSMQKKQRRPSRPPPEHIQESVSTLRDAAKDVVLDAVRLWREQKGAAWTERLLASAFDGLAASEAVLGEVLEGEPARH